MKRFILLSFIAVSFVASALAGRTGTMKIRGVDCVYDTLIHRHVGPGVTYTQFQFNNIRIKGSMPYKMRTHLLTIDMTNPYNRISPYLSKDSYYKFATQEQEVSRQKELGLKPFASINGIGFVQSPPSSSSEPHTYMEVEWHLVHEGLVRYERDTPAVRYYTDADKKGHVEKLTMKAKVTSSKGAMAEIGQINHFRDFAREKNKLALFCNGMDNAKDTQPRNGVEVFLEGSDIRVGTNTLTVVRKKSGCGSSIPQGQCVITGVGTELEAFLNGLKDGETVSIEIDYTDAAGRAVVPTNTYTAFKPNCVTNGVPYGDPRFNVAYTATGVSKDGNTVYLADLEISKYSNPPLRCLEDFLIEIGAWNACYNDGGPSAEMTVDGQFVTNNSIGNEFNGRACPNGIMIYSTAPNDNKLVSVECADISAKRMRVGESFPLQLYGYNQYGEMIDNQAALSPSVEITVPKEIGTFTSGTFLATNVGTGVITIRVKGQGSTYTIPITVEEKRALIISPSKVFTCENRDVQLKAQLVTGTSVTDLDPSQISWSVDDRYVVRSCNNGLVEPYFDGIATVTASYTDVSATVAVEVENLVKEDTKEIDLTNMVSSTEAINLHLPSVPRGVYIEARRTDQIDRKTITLKYKAGEKEVEEILVGKGDGSNISETIMFNYDDPGGYPIFVKSVSPASVEIQSLKAIYTETYSGIDNLYTDETSLFAFSRSGESLTLINCSSATDVLVSVYSLSGVKLAEKQSYLSDAGSCTLEVKMSEPVVVRVQTNNGVQVYKLAGE